MVMTVSRWMGQSYELPHLQGDNRRFENDTCISFIDTHCRKDEIVLLIITRPVF